jgi:hypothetical protein
MKKYRKYIIAFIGVWIVYTIVLNQELDLFGLNWFWALIPIGLAWAGAEYYIKKQKEKEQEEKATAKEVVEEETPWGFWNTSISLFAIWFFCEMFFGIDLIEVVFDILYGLANG